MCAAILAKHYALDNRAAGGKLCLSPGQLPKWLSISLAFVLKNQGLRFSLLVGRMVAPDLARSS